MKRKQAKKGDWEITKIAGLILVLFVMVVLVLAAYRYLRDPAQTLGKTTLDELKNLQSIQAVRSAAYADLSRSEKNQLLDSYAEKNGCTELEKTLKEFEKPATEPKLDPKEEQLTTFKLLVKCYTTKSTYQNRCIDAAAVVDNTQYQKFFTDAEYKKIDRNKKIWVGDTYVYAGQCYQSTEDIPTALRYYQKFIDYKDDTDENTIAQIRKLIADLTAAQNDPNRGSVVEAFTKLTNAYSETQGSGDKAQLESAQKLVSEFITLYKDKQGVTYEPYVATAYYYRGKLEQQIAPIDVTITNEVGKDKVICDRMQKGFGPLVQFANAPIYVTQRFPQLSGGSSIADVQTATISAEALYETTACYAGLNALTPYTGGAAYPSETGQYLSKLLSNYADDPATKLLVSTLDPKCDAVPDNSPDECNKRGADFTTTIPTQFRKLFRCFFQQSDDFAARDTTGFCVACKAISSCEQYGTSSPTCNDDPCGFRNCVEGGGGATSYFSDTCTSK